MNGGEDEVAGLRGLQRHVHRLYVAHLADEDDVRSLPKDALQGLLERVGIDADLSLADNGHLVRVDVLDGILDRDDVHAPAGVDHVDHGSQRGRFSGAGRTGHQHQTVAGFGELGEDGRDTEVFQRADAQRDQPVDHGHGAALHIDAGPDASHVGHGIGEVHLVVPLELLDLAAAHLGVGELPGLFVIHDGVVQRLNTSMDPHGGSLAGADEEVRGLEIGRRAYHGIEVSHCPFLSCARLQVLGARYALYRAG